MALTIGEAADATGTTPEMLHNAIHKGHLDAFKFHSIHLIEKDALINWHGAIDESKMPKVEFVPDDYLSVKEAANQLGIHVHTLRRKINEGKIDSIVKSRTVFLHKGRVAQGIKEEKKQGKAPKIVLKCERCKGEFESFEATHFCPSCLFELVNEHPPRESLCFNCDRPLSLIKYSGSPICHECKKIYTKEKGRRSRKRCHQCGKPLSRANKSGICSNCQVGKVEERPLCPVCGTVRIATTNKSGMCSFCKKEKKREERPLCTICKEKHLSSKNKSGICSSCQKKSNVVRQLAEKRLKERS